MSRSNNTNRNVCSIPESVTVRFLNFYNQSRDALDSWLRKSFTNLRTKSKTKTLEMRTLGNKFYIKKDYKQCYYYYTKSLCYAHIEDESYGLALANRSALFYDMQQYRSCLTDINLCLETLYPKALYPKIWLRQCNCYYHLGHQNLHEKIIEYIEKLQSEESISCSDKEKYKEKFLALMQTSHKITTQLNQATDQSTTETFDSRNEEFAFSSQKIRINYDQLRGRHVIADENLKSGELLFVEKAFFFAPVFSVDTTEFNLNKCFHCLADITSSVPCKTCTLCIYCDKVCRDNSWDEYHKWECEGMMANIWYELGIAFPAVKAIFKGANVGFSTLNATEVENHKKFGDYSNNYGYFDSLNSHLSKIDLMPLMSLSAKVIKYLEMRTAFFSWLSENPLYAKKNVLELIDLVGNLLVKHIAQIICNASIIEHWQTEQNNCSSIPLSAQVACGMYPSVSMMNHSCKSNVSMYYVKDTVIVKALVDIVKNEEILNCYGIDYRYMDKNSRQIQCSERYHFTCNCVVCSNPNLEFEFCDSLLCPQCRALNPVDSLSERCCQCKYTFSNELLSTYRNLESNILEQKGKCKKDVSLDSLQQNFDFAVSHLNATHSFFVAYYEQMYSCHLNKGEFSNSMEYIWKGLEILAAKYGKNARCIGVKMYEIACEMIEAINGCEFQAQTNENKLKVVQEINVFLSAAKHILDLYYPLSVMKIQSLLDCVSSIAVES